MLFNKNKRMNALLHLGFTLVEMLLVLVIISAIIMTGMNYYQQKIIQDKVDKTSLEMQQILTAALTFYAAKGTWPSGATSADILGCLAGNNALVGNGDSCNIALLPPTPPLSPWFNNATLQPYEVAVGDLTATPSDPKFYVYLSLPAGSFNVAGLNTIYANMIAGKMPNGYTSSEAAGQPPTIGTSCDATSAVCSAVASIMPPGSSLVNAGNLNYAGTYNYGGCIPEPKCPTDPNTNAPLQPQVFVVPVSITGMYGVVGATPPAQAFPITSFTAYAKGTGTSNAPSAAPPTCTSGTTIGTGTSPCAAADPTGQKYWRACVDIQTQQGATFPPPGGGNTEAGKFVYVAAFTRCGIPNEPSGTPINIYEH